MERHLSEKRLRQINAASLRWVHPRIRARKVQNRARPGFLSTLETVPVQFALDNPEGHILTPSQTKKLASFKSRSDTFSVCCE